MITIEGTVRNIVFRNKSNCYTVARIDTKEQDIITVIGIFPSITTGEKYSFSGDWVVHKTYGRQFSVEAYEEILPTTKGGIEQYLSSFIKGIGPATAKKLVKHFGTEVFNVLENTPERLREIKGLKKIDKIISSYNEQREVKNIMTYLSGFNIPPGTAVKIYKTYGMACVEILKNNPYQLAEDIWGIGFKLSDRIAMKMGFAIDSPFRIASYITYQLQEATNHGHLFLERKNLVEMTVRDLGLSDDLVEKIISEMIEGKKVIIDDSAVYLKHLYHLEFNIARRLRLFKDISPLEAPEIEEIKTIQREVGVVLSSTQEMALNEAFSEGLLIITGGPGTGKTTTIRSIILRAEDLELSYSIGAPTGRAAKKLSETTGKTAMTIHRLLGYIPGENEFMHDEEDPLDADLVIVDEASMLDIYLFNSLLKGISPYARLILVGDVDQLPSVGPGNVLSDLINCRYFKTVYLKTIFRQAQESSIIVNSHRINSGEYPRDGHEFSILNVEEPEQIAENIKTICTDFLFNKQRVLTELISLSDNKLRDKWPSSVDDIQVLSPMHRGVIGVTNLNMELQKILNPPSRSKREIKVGTYIFREGDKVMQIVNNYKKQVFNGDLGRVHEIDLEEKYVWISFIGDGQLVSYDMEELNELILAYACTIHKSQGSEYPVVIIPVSTQHYIMLQRNLLYTAVTRAENMVFLVGTPKAIYMAIKNDRVSKRNTKLIERIVSEFQE